MGLDADADFVLLTCHKVKGRQAAVVQLADDYMQLVRVCIFPGCTISFWCICWIVSRTCTHS